MKALLLALSLVLVTNAFASDVKVMDISKRDTSIESVSFGVNAELGRAWVKATLLTSTATDPVYSTVRALVSGLSLQGNTVVLDVNGTQIPCGDLNGRKVELTGRCEFEVRGNSIYIIAE